MYLSLIERKSIFNTTFFTSLVFLLASTFGTYWVLLQIGTGVEEMGRRDSVPEFYLVAGLFVIAGSAFYLIREVLFALISPKSFWRKDIWVILLGPAPSE